MKLIINPFAKKKADKGSDKVKQEVGKKVRAGLGRHWRRKLRRKLWRAGRKLGSLAIVAGAAWVLYDQRAVLMDKLKAKLPFGNKA